MQRLTDHEKKILKLVREHPAILNDRSERKKVAMAAGMTEKTLRNRIADLKRYGLIGVSAKTNKSEKQRIITRNDEIDLVKIWRMLIRRKWKIVIITGLFTTIATIYALLATPYYQSVISMYPAAEFTESSFPLGGDLGGIAESFGIGELGSKPSYYIPDIIESRRLKKDIVLRAWINSVYPEGSNLIKYWEIDKPKFFSIRRIISKILPSPKFPYHPHAKHTELGIEKLNKLISVEEDESGLIIVSVLIEEPRLASDITNYIAHFVKEYISFEQNLEAVRNKQFINDQLVQAKADLSNSEEFLTEFRKEHPYALDTPELQQDRGRLIRNIEVNLQVYITLRQQYEIVKIEEAKDNLLVQILDYAEPAVKAAKPRRTLIVILSLFCGIFVSFFVVLVQESSRERQTEDFD